MMEGSSDDYKHIIEALTDLLINNNEFDVFNIPGIKKGNNINSLIFKKSAKLNSIFETSTGNFECRFSEENLSRAIIRFKNNMEDQGGNYWFDDADLEWEDGGWEISLLLSQDGSW